MANLPVVLNQSSLLEESRFEEVVADALDKGMTPAQIAKKLAPEDLQKRKRIRNHIRNKVYHDSRMHASLAVRARGRAWMGLGQTTQALVRRAGRGRVDAAKLVFEITGFHDPKVKHEHSGEVTIRVAGLNDRPPRRIDVDSTAVEDAEVVD